MTNQKYLKRFELSEMLQAMNEYILNKDCSCIMDALTGDYAVCPGGDCRKCISDWLSAEKEEEDT
jgi:hypothetical protein